MILAAHVAGVPVEELAPVAVPIVLLALARLRSEWVAPQLARRRRGRRAAGS